MDWIIDWLKPEQALSKTRLSTFGLCKISLNLNLEGNTKINEQTDKYKKSKNNGLNNWLTETWTGIK